MTQGQVRHFDPQQQRLGLSKDVATLATKLDAGNIDLTLVSLSVCETRELFMNAGSFQQHQFTQIKDIEARNLTSINDRHFQVHLLPRTEINLHIGIERFVTSLVILSRFDRKSRESSSICSNYGVSNANKKHQGHPNLSQVS